MPGSSHPKRYTWWVERKQIAISQTTDGQNFYGPSETGIIVRMYCIYYPTDMSSTDLGADIPDLPEFVTTGILAKVSSWLYENAPETLELAQYHDVQYEKALKDGKEYARGERVLSGSYQIRPYDF